jgi:RNA polymerase sigma-70 factor (ECF subfamily)
MFTSNHAHKAGTDCPARNNGPITCESLNNAGLLAEETILIDRIIQGETNAFEQLIAPCVPAMRRFALGVLRNVEDAEEAVHLATLRAYSHLAAFRREARFSTWFYHIARNEIYQIRRRNRAREKRFSAVEQDNGQVLSWQWPDSSPSQLEVLERKELGRGLQELIASLPEGLRHAFMLSCIEGLSFREIATRMALSVAAVKSRIFRARQILRAREKRHRIVGNL